MRRGELPDYETGEYTPLVEGERAFRGVSVATGESTGLAGGGK